MRKSMTLPVPRDSETFREALSRLLATADSNEVPFSERSWECEAGPSGAWDIDIWSLTHATQPPSRGGETRSPDDRRE